MMKLTIKSSNGTLFEIQDGTTLSVAGSTSINWDANPPSGIVTLSKNADGTCAVTGIGFGQVKITATDDRGDQGTIDLGVGSVLVAAPDGRFWQLKPGPNAGVSKKDLDIGVNNLLKRKQSAVDLTKKTESTAVTCYVLNLDTYTPPEDNS